MMNEFLEFAISSCMYFGRMLSSIESFIIGIGFIQLKRIKMKYSNRGYATCPQCKIGLFGICEFHDNKWKSELK